MNFCAKTLRFFPIFIVHFGRRLLPVTPSLEFSFTSFCRSRGCGFPVSSGTPSPRKYSLTFIKMLYLRTPPATPRKILATHSKYFEGTDLTLFAHLEI